MRPSDEHQANPTEPRMRPNLMSAARRGGHEDSILAKLEREPAQRADATSGARLLWYGGAVLLALGLTAMLALLAAQQGPGQGGPELVHAELVRPAGVTAQVTTQETAQQTVQQTAHDPAPTPAPARLPQTALIVDARPLPAPQPPTLALPVTTAGPAQASASALPPLRLLEPAAARPSAPKTVPPRSLAHAAPQREALKAAAPAPRTASRQGGRPARSAAPARPNEAHSDSDVALISAVIYHANGHALAEPGQAAEACADETCRPRPAR